MMWLNACVLQTHCRMQLRQVCECERTGSGLDLHCVVGCSRGDVITLLACNCRRPSWWEEANLPHPKWPLQLQDGVERTGAGDGVYCRRTVSKRIRHFFSPKSLKCPSAWLSSSLFVFVSSLSSSFNPGPPLIYPGPKWAAISLPSAHPSCTTRRPCVLWMCLNRMQESTAAWPRIVLAQFTTSSVSQSKVCLWWNAE